MRRSTFPFVTAVRETSLARYVDPAPFVPSDLAEREARCEQILAIQVNGLAQRLRHIGAKSAVVGVSGGLDSTLALIVAVLVLPACQGAIDPRIPPWLVEAQRRASATGGVLARAGVLLASLLIVSYLGARALFWVVFTLSVLSVAVVLLRLPRELKV